MTQVSNCCKSLFSCSNEPPKASCSSRAIHAITTLIALSAIAAVVVGALGFVGIIAMINPLAIGLMAGGAVLFLIALVCTYKCGKTKDPIDKAVTNDSSESSGVSIKIDEEVELPK